MKHAHAKHAADMRMTIIGLITLLLVVTLALGGCSTQRYGCPAHKGFIGQNKVIKCHYYKKDGLTSIQWRDSNGKYWSYDGATKEELRAEGLIR